MYLRRSAREVAQLEAHVKASKVPGRDNDYCIDLAHQVRPCTCLLASTRVFHAA